MTHKTHSRKQRTRLDLRFDTKPMKRIWVPVHGPGPVYHPDSRHTTKRRGAGDKLTNHKRVLANRGMRCLTTTWN